MTGAENESGQVHNEPRGGTVPLGVWIVDGTAYEGELPEPPPWWRTPILWLWCLVALLAADAVSERLAHAQTIERVEALERVVEALRAAGYVEVE